MIGAAARPRPVACGLLARLAAWRWLALVVASTMLLVEVPYLIAFLQRANGWVYAGMLWSPHDYAQYASAMRQGAYSEGWLIYDRLSHEPHAPAFMYPFYVGLGKLSRLAGLSTDAVYHAAEILGRVALLLALYHAGRLLFEDRERRRLALLLAIYGSGLGAVLLAAMIWLNLDGTLPLFTATDMALPEFSTFVVLFTAPHLTTGLAAILLWATSHARAAERAEPRALAAAALAVGIVGLTIPFSLVVLMLVAGAHVASRLLTHGRLTASGLLAAGITMAVAAPLAGYNALVFTSDPFWGATYGQQNILPAPHPMATALGYGGVLTLALLGAPALVRMRTEGARLVVVWIVMSAALMYLPVPFQRRLAFGLHPALVLAATLGLSLVMARVRPGPGETVTLRWRLLRSSLAVVLLGSTVTFYLFMVRAVALPAHHGSLDGIFVPETVHQAAAWLAHAAAPEDLVLAETQTANYLAGSLSGRVYSGHWVATAGFPAKHQEVRAFFAEADAERRRAFLERLGVRYLVYGPLERAIGGPAPGGAGLHPVFMAADLTVFQVTPALSAASSSGQAE